MGAYSRIQAYCRQHHSFQPQTCWIASVLEEHGLTNRQAPNRRDPSAPRKPCPARRRPAIVEAIQALGMVPGQHPLS